MVDTALYLIPVQLSDTSLQRVLPQWNVLITREIRYFIVENVRSARRFLKTCDSSINIDELTFYELNRHTAPSEVASFLAPLAAGNAMGVISEAGCPAIADPGADVVAIAQRHGYKVVPLVGPSSIVMGLMGSGFNGQSFAFNGYLPIDHAARSQSFKLMQRRIERDSQTQIFIETPYRNNTLLGELYRELPSRLRLCVASDITGDNESIVTRTIGEWARLKPALAKVPTIFLLYK